MLEQVGGWEISSTVHDCLALNLGPSAMSHSETQIKAAAILFVLKYQSTVKQRRKVSEVNLAGNWPNVRLPNICLKTLKNLCSLTCT